MKLKVLSSGSIGNCYILTDSEGKRLILDAGVGFKKVLEGLKYDLLSVLGVCITHGHKDHSLLAGEFYKRGVVEYRPYEAVEELPKRIILGQYTIQTFPLEHDVPCYGFLIHHPEMGKLVYITDTAYCRFRFQGLNHILVECNYDSRIMDDEYSARCHVLHDHLELQSCKRFIEANRNDGLQNVILCHLSSENISEKTAIYEVKPILPEQTSLYIAKSGLFVEL